MKTSECLRVISTRSALDTHRLPRSSNSSINLAVSLCGLSPFVVDYLLAKYALDESARRALVDRIYNVLTDLVHETHALPVHGDGVLMGLSAVVVDHAMDDEKHAVCNGTGVYNRSTCKGCNGTGKKAKSDAAIAKSIGTSTHLFRSHHKAFYQKLIDHLRALDDI